MDGVYMCKKGEVIYRKEYSGADRNLEQAGHIMSEIEDLQDRNFHVSVPEYDKPVKTGYRTDLSDVAGMLESEEEASMELGSEDLKVKLSKESYSDTKELLVTLESKGTPVKQFFQLEKTMEANGYERSQGGYI